MLSTVNVVALVAPNTTVEASTDVKLVPVITTENPPAFGPVDLERPVIVGGA